MHSNQMSLPMATNLPTENVGPDTMSHFDRVAEEIDQTFNQLIDQLIVRKEFLLRKLQKLREEFHSKEPARRKAVQELEDTQKQLRQMLLKSNIPIHFSCPTRYQLTESIESFGEVSEKLNYLSKNQPIETAGKRGKLVGELDGARGVALDEEKRIVYIADSDNSRVLMFSFPGKFINSFGEEVLKKPWGVTVEKDNIFVTDVFLHSLLRFDKKTLQLTDRVGSEGTGDGMLRFPQGLAVDANGDIYVADCSNNRISIFSKQFKYLSCIKRLRFPQDISLTAELVVVLDKSVKCVRFFTRNGDIVTSNVNKQCLLLQPFFFCLAIDGNFIISDYWNHNIKILSLSGELLHSIGNLGISIQAPIYPEGITMSDAGNIYAVSNSSDYVLQIF